MHTCMLSFDFPSGRTFSSRNNWPLGQNIPGNVYPGHLFLRTDFLTTSIRDFCDVKTRDSFQFCFVVEKIYL